MKITTLKMVVVALTLFTASVAYSQELPKILPALPLSNGVPTLMQIGISTSGKEKIPIMTIMIGDTSHAERLAFDWSKQFGPFALDATLWVRPAEKPGAWKMITYRRPKNIEEAMAFSESPNAFSVEAFVEKLPPPLDKLTAEETAKIEFVISYFAGGAKMYINVGESEDSARELLRAIFEAGDRSP